MGAAEIWRRTVLGRPEPRNFFDGSAIEASLADVIDLSTRYGSELVIGPATAIGERDALMMRVYKGGVQTYEYD